MKSTLLLSVFILALTVLAGSHTDASSSPSQSPTVLSDFEERNVADKWETVNDNVMGGRSKGAPSFANGILTFSGATNTNGGGFSSIRTKSSDVDLSGKSGLLIRARGDGRTFKAEIRTDVTIGRWAVPFRADFTTTNGEWREFYLPFDTFTPTMFGQKLRNPPALDVSKTSSIGFMIYDKQDGPFNLEVDWVKAVDRSQTTTVQGNAGTIVSEALKDGRFKTLAAALTEAELVSVLQGQGPFTVFAPTDEAFAKLPKATVAELLKPENRSKLQAILKYHVAPGELGLVAALEAGAAKTVQGESVSIAFSEGRVRVNGASIIDADIKCSNGVIHVIDSVLLPPKPRNDIASVAKRAGAFSTLLAAAKAAGMDDALANGGPFTVFAPTDEAFNKLPDGTVESLLKKENRDQLKAVLEYHVIPGNVAAGIALNAKEAKTLNGSTVNFTIDDGLLKVNNATIRKTDIACDNGVIHVIDTVLLPPTNNRKSKQDASASSNETKAVERIKDAIERGVPVFNNGNPEKCAAIYEACLETLVNDKDVDVAVRKAIKRLLEFAAHKSDVERAWLYRNGLDQTLISLVRL